MLHLCISHHFHCHCSSFFLQELEPHLPSSFLSAVAGALTCNRQTSRHPRRVTSDMLEPSVSCEIQSGPCETFCILHRAKRIQNLFPFEILAVSRAWSCPCERIGLRNPLHPNLWLENSFTHSACGAIQILQSYPQIELSHLAGTRPSDPKACLFVLG